MLITLFRAVTDSYPADARRMAWDEFVTGIVPANPNEYARKIDLPAFSVAEWPKDTPRSAKTALRAHAIALDFDGLSDEQFAAVVARLAPYRAFLYTTWSHYESPNKFRAVLDITRPVEREDWAAVWARAFAMFPECDRKCKDISRLFFGPFAPAPHAPITVAFDGAPVDIDEWLRMPAVQPTTHPAGPTGLLRLSGKIAKRDKDLGKALAAVYNGEAFAEPGERDDVAFRLACAVAEEWPDESPAVLAGFFASSLALMSRNAEGAPSVENIEDKIRRAQDSYANDITAVERDARAQRMGRLADLGRDAPYSEEEIDLICKEQNVTRDLLRRRWLLIRDTALYILAPGGYRGPYTWKEGGTAILRDLSPASSAGVTLHTLTKTRTVRKTIDTLLEEYGTAVADCCIDMQATRTHYDGRRLVEATCIPRDVKPTQHIAVDIWLDKLAGPMAHKLRSWISALTWLDKPCSALLLVGPGGTGKSLIANGLSRIWGLQPTDIATAMSQYNIAVARQPLILGDETLPKDMRGASRSGELRRIIQDRSRLIHRKFLPDMECYGSLRFIIAANNKDILGFTESLTPDDTAAISARFLYIQVQREAQDFLATQDTRAFAEHMIAEHALWLRDNYKWEPEGRFLVAGGDDALYKVISALSGVRSDLLRWCIAYICEPRKLGASVARAAVKDGVVYVHPNTFEQFWTTYLVGRPPAFNQILRGFETVKDNRYLRIRGQRAYAVKMQHLMDWIKATNYIEEDEFFDMLEAAGKLWKE